MSKTIVFSVFFLLIFLNPWFIPYGFAQHNPVRADNDHRGIPVPESFFGGFSTYPSASDHSFKYTLLFQYDYTMENTLKQPDEVIPTINHSNFQCNSLVKMLK